MSEWKEIDKIDGPRTSVRIYKRGSDYYAEDIESGKRIAHSRDRMYVYNAAKKAAGL